VLTQRTPLRMPTLLHSHLLFCHRTDQPKKAKESASQRTGTLQQFSASSTRQHFGQTEGQLITAVWQKWRFSASYDSLS